MLSLQKLNLLLILKPTHFVPLMDASSLEAFSIENFHLFTNHLKKIIKVL
jgi:hypothetical protein